MTLLDSGTWQGKIYSGGFTSGGGGDYGVVEPATGAELGRLGRADTDDVRRAAARAEQEQKAWAARPYNERAAVLRRAGDLFLEHAGEIAEWLIREGGAIPGRAAFETSTAAEECYEAAALAAAPYGEMLRSQQPRLSFARRLPVGVVGVISPFNVPIVLSIRAVAPALAVGNAVVLKPDPRTAVSGGVVLARIFQEAGLPDGVLHVLPGGVDVGEALVVDPAVRVISFTGSTRAGRSVGALGAQHFKRVHLELGGNSALVILDDVDLEKAASVGAWGSFFNQGQVCMSASRHLVDERVADEYARRLSEHADHLPTGDPFREQVALGPVIDAHQRDRIHSLVTGSVDAGAKLAAGGTYEGLFYRPTVLTGVPTSAPVYAEEIFGPVAPVVAFSSVDELVKLAGDTEYGLSLGILTRDVMKGLAIAERIPSGLVHINDQTINDEASIPFGGVRSSGNGGRLGGAAANMDAFTETQWVTVRGELPDYPF
jgi:benzaldehyde dehydrogenase (NAD)